MKWQRYIYIVTGKITIIIIVKFIYLQCIYKRIQSEASDSELSRTTLRALILIHGRILSAETTEQYFYISENLEYLLFHICHYLVFFFNQY